MMLPAGMTVYARLCGWTLARAHARSGDRVALAACLGGSSKFDQAIADFAETYADQNERDYAALQAAVKNGKPKPPPDLNADVEVVSTYADEARRAPLAAGRPPLPPR
jgi:hypothetical protein